MAFSNYAAGDPRPVGAGVAYGTANQIMYFDSFQDDLVYGVFAKWSTGGTPTLANMDASAGPDVPGVVLMDATYPADDAGVIPRDFSSGSVSVLTSGYVAVKLKDGDTPAIRDRAYAENATAGQYGKATTDNTQIDVNARFIEEIDSDTWLVQIFGQ